MFVCAGRDGKPVYINSVFQSLARRWSPLFRGLIELARETDARKRKGIIDRVQTLFYEDVGQIKFGDMFNLGVVRKELRGDFRSGPFNFFWNAWLEK